MTTRIEYSIASQADKTLGQVEQYCRFFKAPAADALGKEMSVGILAEGVGSENGDRAAQIAATSVFRYLNSHFTTDVVSALTQSIKVANASIIAKQKEDPALAGQGATITMIAIAGDRLFLCGVGHGRAYLVREDEFRVLTLDQNWVSEAIKSWGATPEDIQVHDATPRAYLGKDINVEPQFAPADFFWEGDVIILMTGALSTLLRSSTIRNAVADDSIDESAKRLVELGLEQNGTGNLTAMVIDAPGQTQMPLPLTAADTRALRLSPLVIGLIVGNALLVLIIAAVVIGSGGIGGILASSPTVEIAKPVFLSTPTLPPSVGLDIPEETPFAPTPSVPQAAPTLAPSPTFTPMPLPQGWKQPSAPVPVLPANGTVFGGPDAAVVLGWEPIPNLAQDMFYVVTIRKFEDGKLIGESRNWTKSTRMRLDSSFYSAQLISPGRTTAASPNAVARVAQFQWSVSLYRLTQVQPDGSLTGQPISPPSATLTFLWGPQLQQAPTRVYGSENLKTDPFFQAERRRQASAEATLGPVSVGMAGLWLVLGGLIAAPKLARSRKVTHRRTRT